MTENHARADERWNKAILLLRDGDSAGAMHLFEVLLRDGEKSAYREIGNIHELEGRYEEARKWYARAIEIANDAGGCMGLGRMNYYGKGGPRDYSVAFEYYSMIEDKQYPVVDLMLGRMYSFGRGVAQDYAKAMYYFERSYRTGNLIAFKNIALLEIRTGSFLSGAYHLVLAFVRILSAVYRNPHALQLRRN